MPAKRSREPRSPPEAPIFRAPVAVARLVRAEKNGFDIRPDADERAAIAALMGLKTLSAVRFKGNLMAAGEEGWLAHGRLTADLEQECVVTLAPVRQRVNDTVRRLYVPDDAIEVLPEIDLDMDADDEPDTFEREIDLGALMIEALALALDPYPRAEGAELDTAIFAPPGAEPLTDEALKPFAKLEALRDKLAGGDK